MLSLSFRSIKIDFEKTRNVVLCLSCIVFVSVLIWKHVFYGQTQHSTQNSERDRDETERQREEEAERDLFPISTPRPPSPSLIFAYSFDTAPVPLIG